MHPKLTLPMVSALAMLLAGCAATPENENLLQARGALASLLSKPESNTMAPIETKAAFDAVAKADLASNQNRTSPDIDQLAYIASQKAALAEQTILGRQAEAGLKAIDAERIQVQLDVRTQQLKAMQAMKAKPSDRGHVVTFGDVLFDTGKSVLKYTSQRDIQQLASFLNENPERKVRVEGFTDNTGGELLNLRLSEQRAAAVSRALEKQGIGAERISIKGYGMEFPITDNGTAQARQLNRRVEVIISNGSDKVRARI
ncbi:OmpA family protein [Pseudomonas sp. P9_35]|uniref:OmpA family protein n=1 Tax=unclassified Pseudomonas TaxID=196821 RepID=UPI002A366E2A|nr:MULTISPECIES: OmpA family protein [unclassified Pseudomonas]WPN65654.1 OmpA family protein [Pseudomonas sp. P9_32]WPN71405.1 OmpA family protein [Pseudomonas sp. P9_35]